MKINLTLSECETETLTQPFMMSECESPGSTATTLNFKLVSPDYLK